MQRVVTRRQEGWALVKIGVNRGTVVPDNHLTSDANLALIPDEQIFSLGKATLKFRHLVATTVRRRA